MASSRIRRTLTAASAAAMLSMLAACSQAAAAAPQDDDTIVYAHQQEPQCLFGGWIEQAYISYQFLDNLFSLDENGEAVPWLAEDWSRSEDGLTYTIDLQSGVSFTDGTPVDAEAVAHNFDYWVAGGNSTAQVWLGGYYESAEAIDDLTVEVHLSRPYTRFIENLTQSYFGIQSQHALETRTDEENCRAPIGSGAFVVDEWNRGENVILTRNDDYTSPPANARHDGPAYVKTIDWRFIPEGITRVSALKAGEADAIYDIPAVEWADVDEGGYELHKYVTPGRPQQVSFNTTRAPFDEEDVRKAFILSLDRKKIVKAVGYGVIPYEGNGAISRATPGYDEGRPSGTHSTPTRRMHCSTRPGGTSATSRATASGTASGWRRSSPTTPAPSSTPTGRRSSRPCRSRRARRASRSTSSRSPRATPGRARTAPPTRTTSRPDTGRRSTPGSSTSTGVRAPRTTRTSRTAPSTTTPSSSRSSNRRTPPAISTIRTRSTARRRSTSQIMPRASACTTG